jgi:hypothetical protein
MSRPRLAGEEPFSTLDADVPAGEVVWMGLFEFQGRMLANERRERFLLGGNFVRGNGVACIQVVQRGRTRCPQWSQTYKPVKYPYFVCSSVSVRCRHGMVLLGWPGFRIWAAPSFKSFSMSSLIVHPPSVG